MPELAELKLTADYVNVAAQGRTFTKIEKNPVHKGADVTAPFNQFTIQAQSKGKELLLELKDLDSDQVYPIRMGMGMSGHFRLTQIGQEDKHAHLKFGATDDTVLAFVDVRRFGNWKAGESWSDNRGPDPTTDYREFFLNIMTNLAKAKFNKPLFEVLMDQRYFNGIGNYLRAEIVYRAEVDPFLPAEEQITKHPKILELCRDIPMLAYQRGGGSIKDWRNPFGTESQVGKFMLCYGNKEMDQRIDSNGRRFWYDPKWDLLDLESEWDYYSGLPNPKAYERT